MVFFCPFVINTIDTKRRVSPTSEYQSDHSVFLKSEKYIPSVYTAVRLGEGKKKMYHSLGNVSQILIHIQNATSNVSSLAADVGRAWAPPSLLLPSREI